jgi:hypothetical protein
MAELIEIIVGTYEEYILGYKLRPSVNEVSEKLS